MELTKEYFDEKLSQLVTKDHLDERLSTFATKTDLEQLATKGDLEKFATKNDLLRFATKDDLLELATKTNLDSVRADIAEIKALVQRIDQRTDEDHRAALRDISDLKRRISILENPAASQ